MLTGKNLHTLYDEAHGALVDALVYIYQRVLEGTGDRETQKLLEEIADARYTL